MGESKLSSRLKIQKSTLPVYTMIMYNNIIKYSLHLLALYKNLVLISLRQKVDLNEQKCSTVGQ